MLSQKESIAISYIRVLAMISIVLCHVFMCLRLKYNDDFRYLSLSLNIGVQVFFVHKWILVWEERSCRLE